jgi:hypothetical protein
MNKWEDSFKRNEPSCYCSSNQGLFVPNRQLSLIVAGLLFLGFCTFMTGYFLGKKNVVEQFSEKIQKEAFADQVYTTVLANAQEQENDLAPINSSLVTDVEIAQMDPQSIETMELVPDSELPTTFYYGQLIGFGTEKAAHLFVNKLASKGIDTEIKKRVSKTVKGRTSYWYQVVTPAYSNKNDLIVLVDRIAKEENIKDASICACPISS